MATIKEYWQNYLFLTQELDKFLTRQDTDMVLELISQRDSLQSAIDEEQDQGFIATPEGKKLLEEIQQLNQGLILRMQILRNRLSQQNTVSQAYDGLGQQMAGNWMDRQS